jgi:hypothetical protein
MQVNYHVLSNSLIINFAGKTISIHKEDSRYNAVISAIKEDRLADIPNLVDYENHFTGALQLKNGLLHLDGTALPNCLSDRVLQFQKENLPYEYLIKFARKLQLNPSFNSRQQLFKFLEHNGHPITPNGNFIAYRGVTEDFKDCHTRTFDNSVGSVCSIKRSQVDDNPNNTCSRGLHVACYEYAKTFGQQMIEVEVDPRDVVAVPTDYNGTKMRVCKFVVVNECKGLREESLYNDYAENVEIEDDFGESVAYKVTSEMDDDILDSPETLTSLPRFSRKVKDSSTVVQIEYRDNNLTVHLTSGNTYRYYGVPNWMANAFMNSASKGKYFTEVIKDWGFSYKQLK